MLLSISAAMHTIGPADTLSSYLPIGAHPKEMVPEYPGTVMMKLLQPSLWCMRWVVVVVRSTAVLGETGKIRTSRAPRKVLAFRCPATPVHHEPVSFMRLLE